MEILNDCGENIFGGELGFDWFVKWVGSGIARRKFSQVVGDGGGLDISFEGWLVYGSNVGKTDSVGSRDWGYEREGKVESTRSLKGGGARKSFRVEEVALERRNTYFIKTGERTGLVQMQLDFVKGNWDTLWFWSSLWGISQQSVRSFSVSEILVEGSKSLKNLKEKIPSSSVRIPRENGTLMSQGTHGI